MQVVLTQPDEYHITMVYFALLHEARTALRAVDLTVEGSQRYAAWDSDLYHSEVWCAGLSCWS